MRESSLLGVRAVGRQIPNRVGPAAPPLRDGTRKLMLEHFYAA